jgi:hypothetical protein
MANKLQGLSYPQLVAAYNRGALNWDDVRDEYKRLRDTAMRQIRRIKKSDVPYIDENSQPKFKAPSELKTLSDYLHETADINRFMGNKNLYSIAGRRAHRDTLIDTLRARGWNVNRQNWLVYLAFIRWYQSHADALIYDSKDPRIIAFFNQNYTRANMEQTSRWQRVFRDAKKQGYFDSLNRYTGGDMPDDI